MIIQILGVCAKSPRQHLFVDFSKAFDSKHRGKMEQILLAYGLPKETITAIMMLYKNTKVKVHSPDRDRFLWHCYRCTARGHISSIPIYYLPRLCASNVNRFNERKWLYFGKRQEAEDTPQTLLWMQTMLMTVLLANTLAQAESLLHSLEQVA